MPPVERPLRIAHLAFSALPSTVGGLEIVVDNLIRKQIVAGHEPSLVTRWKQAEAARHSGLPYRVLALPPNPNPRPVPYRDVGPRLPTAAGIAWHQLRCRFDVWHAHWIYPTGWMAQDILDLVGVPLVLTAHGADIETDPASGHGFRLNERNDRRTRQVLARAEYLTAISSATEQRFLEAGVPDAKITRIPNGVDFGRFLGADVNSSDVRRRYGLPMQGKMILTVGSDRPAKGHKFIPETLAHLRARGRDLFWVIVGGGPATMAPLAESAGVTAQLFVIPPVGNSDLHSGKSPSDEVIALYRSADLFVMPSLSEGFGMAALEAMAAGLPVLASDVGGLPSFIAHGENGLLVPPGDIESLEAAIVRVLDSSDGGARLGKSALSTAESHDWSEVSDQYIQLYRRATGGMET